MLHCIALLTRYLIIDGENLFVCVLASGWEEMHDQDKWLEQVYTKHSIPECTLICVNFIYISQGLIPIGNNHNYNTTNHLEISILTPHILP